MFPVERRLQGGKPVRKRWMWSVEGGGGGTRAREKGGEAPPSGQDPATLGRGERHAGKEPRKRKRGGAPVASNTSRVSCHHLESRPPPGARTKTVEVAGQVVHTSTTTTNRKNSVRLVPNDPLGGPRAGEGRFRSIPCSHKRKVRLQLQSRGS